MQSEGGRIAMKHGSKAALVKLKQVLGRVGAGLRVRLHTRLQDRLQTEFLAGQ